MATTQVAAVVTAVVAVLTSVAVALTPVVAAMFAPIVVGIVAPATGCDGDTMLQRQPRRTTATHIVEVMIAVAAILASVVVVAE